MGGEEEEEEKVAAFNLVKKSDTCESCDGSTAAWLMENAPASPSPICSPSRLSCSSPRELLLPRASTELLVLSCRRSQSTCVTSDNNGSQTDKTGAGKEKGRFSFSRCSYQHKLRHYGLYPKKIIGRNVIDRGVASEVKPGRHANPLPIRTRGVTFCNEFDINSSADNRSRDSIVDSELQDVSLSPTCEEQRDIPRVSFASELTVSEGGYLDSGGSTFDSSRNESPVDGEGDFPFPCSKRHGRCFPHSAPNSEKKDSADKLNVWKQAQTEKLVTSLRKKEAAINAWEAEQTNKARTHMTQIENKLEKKRLKSFRKMQKSISNVQKMAEEKKVKERRICLRKISKLNTVKFSASRKLPWLLLFF
ncbi:hypothetical protein EJ110_NYTH38783 [Nymphaea thermarum]|nr:hypothetical protein EJ110_NYTH38783 [Nymphaea thermarum]